MLSRNSTSFLINNMSTTYTHQKFYSAPTHFFGNTSFSWTLYKPKIFDHLIKAFIPTPRCLLQSLEGLLELCILVSIFQDWQNLLVVSHTTFPQENHQGNNVLISYLQDFINNAVTAKYNSNRLLASLRVRKSHRSQLLELAGKHLNEKSSFLNGDTYHHCLSSL